jgi:SpoIID/LytB domain protein
VIRIIIVFFLLLFQLWPASFALAEEKSPYDLYREGFLTKAAEAYAAEAENNNNARPLMNASMCLRQAGKYKEAETLLQQAAAREPENGEIFSELGWLKFHQADYENAKNDFTRALELNPELHRAELGLGSVYSSLENKEEMIKHLNRYKTMRPDFAGVDYIIASNYMKFQMYKEAEDFLISALRKDQFFTEARIPLAGIYIRQHNKNAAWNQYVRALAAAPSHPVALKMKNRLRKQGRFARQPDEIRPPFKIAKPLKMEPVDAVKKLLKSVKLRVGLGTNNMGGQGTNNILRLKSFNGMTITGKNSQKVFATVPPDEVWTAVWQGGSFIMKNDKGKSIGPFTGTVIITPRTKNGTVIFEAYRKTKNPWFRTGDRQYRGSIELFPSRGRGIGVVNVVEAELYLLGVVPSEVSPQWPFDSLKAQAVIARTQILIRRARGGMHRKDGYDICDGQHCQAYKGKSNEHNSTSKAVIDTEGEILTYKGRPAETFFHASCGGWIQASGEVNGWARVPYLVSHEDGDPDHPKQPLDPWDLHIWLTGKPEANCNDPQRVSPSKFRWMKILRQKDITMRVNRSHKIGEITDIIPLQRSRAGNVNSLKIKGIKGEVTITREHLIRNILGFTSLKSTLFDLEINRREDGSIKNYWIYGGGWGHGIGLCQSGSASLAGHGKSYRQILDFYFPGTRISKIKYYSVKKKTAPQTKLVPTKKTDTAKPERSDSSDDVIPDIKPYESVAPKGDESINQDNDGNQGNDENHENSGGALQMINSYSAPSGNESFDFLPAADGDDEPLLPLRKGK